QEPTVLSLTTQPPPPRPPSGDQENKARGQRDEQVETSELDLKDQREDGQDAEDAHSRIDDASVLSRAIAYNLCISRAEDLKRYQPSDDEEEGGDEIPDFEVEHCVSNGKLPVTEAEPQQVG